MYEQVYSGEKEVVGRTTAENKSTRGRLAYRVSEMKKTEESDRISRELG